LSIGRSQFESYVWLGEGNWGAKELRGVEYHLSSHFKPFLNTKGT